MTLYLIKNFSLNLKNVFLILVFIFLFQSSLSRTLLPNFINVIGVIVSFILVAYYLAIQKHKLYIALILAILMLFSMWSYISIGENPFDLHVFSFILVLFVSIAIKEDILVFVKPMKIFLIINLMALIWEKIEGNFFIEPALSSDYGSMSAYYYGQGLNTYAKGAAELVAISLLFFRNDNVVKIVIFVSTLFIGVRSAIVLAIVIIIIDYIFLFKWSKKFTISTLFFGILMIIGCWLIINDIIYSGRYLSSFDLQSPTYVARWWIVNRHIECYLSLPLFQQLFGSGSYCANLYSWGSESFPVQLLTYYGVFFFCIYLLMVITIFVKIITSPRRLIDFYPFLLILLMGIFVRFPLGWFGGSVFFGLLFIALFEKQKWGYIRSKIGLKSTFKKIGHLKLVKFIAR